MTYNVLDSVFLKTFKLSPPLCFGYCLDLYNNKGGST